jgi:hypothetical protein
MDYHRWGYNARGASQYFFAAELAQPIEAHDITDGQVRAFCWMVEQARKVYPLVPLYFPTHSELDGTPVYGPYHDGKTDVFSKGSPRIDELRTRIAQRLEEIGIKGESA